MAGSRAVWEGALKQAGLISVKSFEEVLDCLYAFHLQPLPQGRRVGIISGPGGIGVATTDRCLELGLEVPQFSRHTVERLRKTMPRVVCGIDNPVDLTLASLVTPRVYGDAIRILIKEERVDMLLLIAVIGGEHLRDIILEAMDGAKTKKPLVVTVKAGSMQSAAQDVSLLLASGIPVFSDAARAAKALARLAEYAHFRAGSSGAGAKTKQVRKATSVRKLDPIAKALREGRTILSEHESKQCLRAYGVPVTREREAYDMRTLREALSEIGYPCVIKANSPNLTHKTERGLVYVDIRNEQEAVAAFRQIASKIKAEGAAVLVQEMIRGDRELMLGLTRDDQFGPCVMFGLGGIFSEALKDISFRVAPITKLEALEMIDDIKARSILRAFRGMPAADRDQLAELLVKVGTMGLDQINIKEIDINPVILSEGKPVAVDALIVLTPPGPALRNPLS